MKRLRITDELAAKLDAARGDVPRDRWAQRVLEQVLSAGEPGGQSASSGQGRSPGSKPGERGSTPRSPASHEAELETSPANPRTRGRADGSAASARTSAAGGPNPSGAVPENATLPVPAEGEFTGWAKPQQHVKVVKPIPKGKKR